MQQRLVQVSELAKLLRMEHRYVKRACATVLKDAMSADLIDINHICVVRYIQKRKTVASIVETDTSKPMYDRALDVCTKTGLWSVKNIRKNLPIGDKKAAQLLELMKQSGQVPENYNKRTTRASHSKPIKQPNPVKKTVYKPLKESELGLGMVAPKPKPIKEPEKIDESLFSDNPPLPQHIAKYGHKSLYELVAMFGSDLAFYEWMKGAELLEKVLERQRKNAEGMNLLVNQEVFKIGIFEPIDTLLRNILTDGADNIVQQVMALTKAGCTEVECKKYFVEIITSFIRPMKTKIKKTFKQTETKDV